MRQRKFKLKREIRQIATLRNSELVIQIGHISPDQTYMNELSYLGIYKTPVITPDGRIITLPEYVDAARALGETTIEVLVLIDATETDCLRMMNFDNRQCYKGNKLMLYNTIKSLQEHLWNTDDGRIWCDELPGKDINDKIGSLVGFAGSTISLIKYIGDNAVNYLAEIDDPDSTTSMTTAKFKIEAEKKANARNDNFSGVEKGNMPPTVDGDNSEEDNSDINQPAESDEQPPQKSVQNAKPQPTPAKGGKTPAKQEKKKPEEPQEVHELTAFTVSFGKYGTYELDLSGDKPTITKDGDALGTVIIEPNKHNKLKEALHFNMLSDDGKWGFQVIGTRLINTIDEKEVSSY